MSLYVNDDFDTVYEFEMYCYHCNMKTRVYFPEDIADFIYDIDTIKKRYNAFEGKETMGNICSNCGHYIPSVLVVNHIYTNILDKDNINSDFLEKTAIYVYAFNND